MPILSQQPTNTDTTSSDPELPTFRFVSSWILFLTVMILISKSRVGYVAIYYSLLLIIVLILVTEYATVAPLLSGIQTIGQFNQKSAS